MIAVLHFTDTVGSTSLCFNFTVEKYLSVSDLNHLGLLIYYAPVFVLYFYMVTGLYSSWDRFAIYYATVFFLYLYRVTDLYGSWGRFAIYYATVFSYIFTG